ncbi:MAG: chemotaxis protein CheW [Pseudomonadota bacterium]
MEHLANSMTEELGFFSPRGSLDGELEGDFKEKERFIGFKITDEIFYLPISNVSEIIMLVPITYVPRSMEYIEGIINVRGTIIPTINLRKMMGYSRTEASMSSRIIIVRTEKAYAGLLVDGITVVASFSPSEIEIQALPTKNPNVDIITRVTKVEGKISGILDSSKILECASYEKNKNSVEVSEKAAS